MRKDGLLLLLALALAFLSGKIMFSIRSEAEIDFTDLEVIRNLHSELRENIPPYQNIDLNQNYDNPEKIKLLITNQTFAQKKIVLNSSECLKAKLEQISSSFVNKENLWLSYLCHQISSLPRNFFNSPPYLHSSGLSYAYMRFRMLQNENRKRQFLNRNANFMHISELKKLRWTPHPDLRFIVSLSEGEINKIVEGKNVFMNSDLYFIKTAPLKYFVLEREKARKFFALARFDISDATANCGLNITDICWEKRPHNVSSLLSQSSSILFIFTIIFLIIIAFNLSSRIKRQKIEEERKKHALRVLTHELRTPIAALLLQLNNLEQEDMDTKLREKLAQIEGEVYRLKFLADRSRSYLQTDKENTQVFKLELIESLEQIIEETILDFPTEKIIIAGSDTEIYTDPYWLKICLKNLIENSIRYGTAPIRVEIEQNETEIKIIVEDQGEIKFHSIKEILKSKHENSVGLGIGLNIVNKTIKQMGGNLSLTRFPTRFITSLPRRKHE